MRPTTSTGQVDEAHRPAATCWYAACPECFHVDVADSHQDIPGGCSNCGFVEPARRKRMFVEPKGFVTSIADSKGKDPGTSRRRVKPADEARLIAAPRPENFQETELPFLSTALLLARGSEDNDLKGSLFVANRGTYGEGYYRCLVCNFCQPASKGRKVKSTGKKVSTAGDAAAKKFVHKDPSSGATCKSDVMPKLGVDFAHMFNTDVPKGDAVVKELGRNRTFHDRELTFDVVDQAGCSAIHRYFLTGGIDYLLDERSDTRVFHAVATK